MPQEIEAERKPRQRILWQARVDDKISLINRNLPDQSGGIK